MTKAEARQHLRDLPPLSAGEAAKRSLAICEQVRAHAAWRDARVVALYSASRHEPALDALWENDASRIFAFPRVDGHGLDAERLAFHRVSDASELLPSRWGLREPAPVATTLVQPQDMDLVLVPGVAFSPTGERLGRGRGHYDRFLPRLRDDAVVIGICFRERLLPDLPLESHDHMMHAVISG
jgi:5-formyltetrahydrofolate cyclo-ligase